MGKPVSRAVSLPFAIALAAASCGKDTSTKPPGITVINGPEGSVPVAPPAPKPKAAMVELYVDDTLVGRLDLPHLSSWPRVDTLVPASDRRLGMWDDVFILAGKDTPTELHQPSATYRNLVPALFPGDGGVISFGMFDPVELAKHGQPSLREDGVREIRIRLAKNSGRGEHDTGDGGPSTDPTAIRLAVKSGQGENVLTGEQLLAIKRSPLPGETGDGKGWPLSQILDAAGVKAFQRLQLTDAAGLKVTLDKSDFDAKASIPFIKLNRQGQLRVRVFKKQGDAWEPSGDLRGLMSIQVLN